MKSKHKIKRILLGSLVLAFASVLTVSCNKSNDNTPKISPKYILSGDKKDTDSIYDYYDIGNGELAVSLKDDIKETYDLAISVPSSHTYTENGNSVTKPVTGIWHNAFHNCPSTSITLTDSITVIDFEAFLYSKITTISIPYTVTEIGDAAFYSCNSLTTVKIANSDQEGSGSACTCDEPGQQQQQVNPVYSRLARIPSFCFFNCSAMTNLSLPASITEVAEEAFNGCVALSSAILFSNIEIIRARAFQGCYALRTVYISSSLFDNANNIGIEPHAFNYCHDNLDIVFCGTTAKVNAWKANHPLWGWKNDLGDPDDSANLYTGRIDTSSTYYSTEWAYKYTIREGVPEVTITDYYGQLPTEGFISIPNSMPYPEGNKVVRIEKGVFDDDEKLALERIYLPTTLLAIESLMFRSGYKNLYVVDDNGNCAEDKAKADAGIEIEGRIDLHNIENLEFIGMRSFSGIGTRDSWIHVANTKIKTVHLPARLRAIGNEAFGIYGRRMLPNVDKFLWDYDDEDSILEVVGADTFYGLGYATGANNNNHSEIVNNETRRTHTASTIIFPRTFKHFGFISSDYTRYRTAAEGRTNLFDFRDQTIPSTEQSSKQGRPSHAFIGCSLLGKVIFKGDAEDETKTNDLVIPLQTFVYNESLRTIIFEERKNHYIEFHTQSSSDNGKNYHYAQESIGSNAGHGSNDFRGEPFLQTFVLPNQVTKLRIQNFAFHGNSRAVIYLSGSYGSKMYHDDKDGVWKNMNFEDGDFVDANTGKETAIKWKNIGDEEWYASKNSAGYYGYCFSTAWNTNKSGDDSINYFGISQDIPVYDNIHYKEIINDPNDATTADDTVNSSNLTVEVGNAGSDRKEYVEKDYCSYILENKTKNQITTYEATMTKYLYSLYNDKADKTTAKVVESITSSFSGESHSYTVTKIGDSAFSACFCDGKDTSPNKTVGQFSDLTNIELPNSIVEIGEYAFIRAYGVQKISSYTGNGAATEGMPSSLRYIGKNAFTFCGIKKVLKIPYECKFYENYENEADTHKTTSIFSNSVDLRKVTFLDSTDAEGNASWYYTATTYSATAGGTNTCAIYSNDVTTGPNSTQIKDNKGNNTTWHNGNRLLIILNRENADIKKPSADATVNTADTGLVFDGKYRHDNSGNGIPFLYGAYKMGYWITELITGSSTVDGNDNKYAQPLFSAIGSRTNSTKTLTVRYIYLGVATTTYDSTSTNTYSNLTTITGDVLELPRYGTNACENLNIVEFPNETNATIPEGVFANNSKTNTNYKTTDAAATHGADTGYLDLRGTGYSAIGKDAFKNNSSIVHFIAPNVANFTIGESAFEDCANLTDIDLSNVTGTITIKKNAFKNTKLNSITWPASATVKIEEEGIFSSCKSLTSVVLPVGLYNKIGPSVFSGCSNLASVTCAGNLSITKIDTSAFSSCGKLNTFDFDHMPSLTTISGSAFNGAGKLVNVGATNVTTLPSSVSNIGGSAFKASKVVAIVIQSTPTVTIGANAFESCTSLTAVRFTNRSCGWGANNADVFKGCTSLNELQLPTGYLLNNAGSSIMTDDTAIKIYSYTKYTGANATENWRQTSSGVSKPIYYNVTSVQDLLDGNVITNTPSASVLNQSTEFWYVNASGVAVYLGTVSAYNGTTVTFSTGYTLSGTTFTAP